MTTQPARSPVSLLTVGGRDEEEVRQRPLEFGLIARLFSFTKPYAVQQNWLVLMVVLRSIQLPALTWVLAAVINGPVERRDVTGVLWGVAAFAGLALSTQLVLHFRQRLALELGEAVVFDIRNQLFEHIHRMPMSWFNRTKVGRIISRMGSDVEDVRVGVQEVLFVSLVQLGQMIVAAGCMIWYDRVLFLLVLALVPVIWVINRSFHWRLSEALRAMRESFSRVTSNLAESVLGVRVTQGFVRQDENAKMFQALAVDHSRYNTAVIRTHGLFVPLLELNNQLIIAALLIAGSYRVLVVGAESSVGDLVGFFFMANLFFSPISVLGNQYNQAMTAMAGAERVFKLLDTPPEWEDPATAVALPPLVGRVEFDDVTFSYQPDRPVLDRVSFVAEPGQTVALVGHTGSGKTTITNLIAKFYLANSGTIRVDGHDIRTIQGHSLHRQMGIVLQQNFLFHSTIAENIRLVRPEATTDEVFDSVRQLGCLDLFATLPQGFQTIVGERGVAVSAGQRQLICFARALLADPRILILDEATSSIDTQTEARLQAALAVLLRGRTSFVVAHRLSTVRSADLVLVLDHGRIVESGNHAELMAHSGPYAALHRCFQSSASA